MRSCGGFARSERAASIHFVHEIVIMRKALLILASAIACEGPVGPAGENGAANVSSGTFTVSPQQYTNDFWYFPVAGGTQANPAKVATVAVPAITNTVLSSGAVFVYLRIPTTSVGAADHWTLLPFHQGGFGGGYLTSIKAAVREGQIRIGYVHESTSSAAPPDVYALTLPTYEFRWVTVEGTPVTSLSALASTDPDALMASLIGSSQRAGR